MTFMDKTACAAGGMLLFHGSQMLFINRISADRYLEFAFRLLAISTLNNAGTCLAIGLLVIYFNDR